MEQDLNKDQLDALHELLTKIPPEDLEKAVGGVSSKTKKIIGGLGLAALAAIGRYLYNYTDDSLWPISRKDMDEYKKFLIVVKLTKRWLIVLKRDFLH